MWVRGSLCSGLEAGVEREPQGKWKVIRIKSREKISGARDGVDAIEIENCEETKIVTWLWNGYGYEFYLVVEMKKLQVEAAPSPRLLLQQPPKKFLYFRLISSWISFLEVNQTWRAILFTTKMDLVRERRMNLFILFMPFISQNW